ncbi:MAG: DUF1287 domain-containing protein [Verrucomicrobiales bacterium]|jgi:uncharacterized protein YijF (DUF1287 family)|nr:DUF1287 domain-containing protein [Verrucomicrobiales bacterium]
MKTALAIWSLAAVFCASLLAEPLGVDADRLVVDARKQVGVTLTYDPAYRSLAYPNGDVPPETGVCADVVVRALRGQGIDLQKLVHDDMVKNFSKYPQRWGLKNPDANIDHRRVPNLMAYFTRRGNAVAISADGRDYLAGDIAAWNLNPNGFLPHIGIVSNKKSANGEPLMIHNIGNGAQEDSGVLFQYKIIGHYRL